MPHIEIQPFSLPQPCAALASLEDLLCDAVNNGASLGFRAPLPRARATEFWKEHLRPPIAERTLWVACHGAQVVGAVTLDRCQRENARHRGELQKLMVLHAFRGQGVASALVRQVEGAARAEGLLLLVLGAEANTPAGALYRKLGWTWSGQFPVYARGAQGHLHATDCFHKQLQPQDAP